MGIKNQSDIILLKICLFSGYQQLGSGFVFLLSDPDELMDQLKLL